MARKHATDRLIHGRYGVKTGLEFLEIPFRNFEGRLPCAIEYVVSLLHHVIFDRLSTSRFNLILKFRADFFGGEMIGGFQGPD